MIGYMIKHVKSGGWCASGLAPSHLPKVWWSLKNAKTAISYLVTASNRRVKEQDYKIVEVLITEFDEGGDA